MKMEIIIQQPLTGFDEIIIYVVADGISREFETLE
jgi:hypothetical protein